MVTPSLLPTFLICICMSTLFGISQNSVQHEKKYAFRSDTVIMDCHATTPGTMSYTVNDLHQHDPAVLVRANLQRNGSYNYVEFTAKEEHNSTVFRFIETVDGTSTTLCSYILLVEEPIEPSTNVSVERKNDTHSILQWTPPSGHSGTYEVEVYFTGAQRNETIRLKSPGYAFLRYGFPVTFTVFGVSMAGKGKPASFNYVVPSWCQSADAIEGSVYVGVKNNSISSVIGLYLVNANSCFSEVSVQVQEYNYLSQTSLPTIHGDWAVIVLDDLPSQAYLDVSVSLKNLNCSIRISTHTVQDVNVIDKEENATVECVFLDGLSNATCYVVVKQEGIAIYNETISGLITLDIPGNYTVLVYYDIMEKEPAFRRNVTRSMSDSSDRENKSTPLYAIFAIAILVGIAVIVGLVVTGLYFCCKRKWRRTFDPNDSSSPSLVRGTLPETSLQLSTPTQASSDDKEKQNMKQSLEETGTELQSGKMESGRDSQTEYQRLLTARRNSSATSSVHRHPDPEGKMQDAHEEPKTKDHHDHIAIDLRTEDETEFSKPMPVDSSVQPQSALVC